MNQEWCNDILSFDLETTGPDSSVDTMVSVGLCRYVNRQLEHSEYGLVNPGRPIPEEATGIHGITDAQVADAMPLGEAVERTCQQIVTAGRQSVPIVGMNVCFDLSITDRLAREHLGQSLQQMGWTGPVLDILVLDRHVDKYRKGHRTLLDLCAVYGVEHHGAHGALDDADASARVLFSVVDKYPHLLTIDIDRLMRAQSVWYQQWAQDYNRYRMRQGKPEIRVATWPIDSPPVPVPTQTVASMAAMASVSTLVQCRGRTTTGRQCQIQLYPGSRCPSHPQFPPAMTR